jgi:epoxide hydrolase 4
VVKQGNSMRPPRLLLRPSDFEHRTVRVDTLSMHVVVAGPEDGPLVVLLHGFSEFWYIWRYQIQALGQAGFSVVAPDQRGYNLTDKRGPYDPFTITRDVGDLIRAFGRSRAHVVGQDWGGVIAWFFAAFYPEMVDRLVISNAAHPAAYRDTLLRPFWPQIYKSLYTVFFSVPWIAERLLLADNCRRLVRSHLETRSPNKPTDEELG